MASAIDDGAVRTEQVDPSAGQHQPAPANEENVDLAAASASQTRELSTLLSQAWSGRS